MSAGFNIKLPPPDEFGRIPAALPPPGVKSNFDNPEWIGDRVVITTAICFALSMVFVGLRLYTRVCISHAAGLEDALIAFSWVSAGFQLSKLGNPISAVVKIC